MIDDEAFAILLHSPSWEDIAMFRWVIGALSEKITNCLSADDQSSQAKAHQLTSPMQLYK
jgi:hypothetical protein